MLHQKKDGDRFVEERWSREQMDSNARPDKDLTASQPRFMTPVIAIVRYEIVQSQP